MNAKKGNEKEKGKRNEKVKGAKTQTLGEY